MLTEPATLAPSARAPRSPPRALIDDSVPVSTKTLPASGPTGSVGLGRLAGHVDAGRWPGARRAPVARLVGEHSHRRGDDGPDVGNRLQRLERRVEHPLHRPELARERRRRLLADVADAQRVDQARQVVPLAALDLRDDVAADLAQFARPRPLGSRLARRDDERLERGASR